MKYLSLAVNSFLFVYLFVCCCCWWWWSDLKQISSFNWTFLTTDKPFFFSVRCGDNYKLDILRFYCYFLKWLIFLGFTPFCRHTLECFPQVNIGLALKQNVLSIYILHKCMLINKLASVCIAHKVFFKEDLYFIDCKIWILLYLSYCSFLERGRWKLEGYVSYT